MSEIVDQITSLQTFGDYYPALLWLVEQAGALRAADATGEFDRRFGHLIPPEQRRAAAGGVKKWETMLRSARENLARAGLMNDYNSDVWSLTESGQRWLREHPDGAREELQQLLVRRSQAKRRAPAQLEPDSDHTPQSRDGLAHKQLDRQISRIRRLLRGIDPRPTDEVLCDWVYLCYTFELYAEGHALFALIDPTVAPAAFYERARKLARACRLALGRRELEGE
jgi:hypothetical protein